MDRVTTGSLDYWSDNLKLVAADGHDVAASTEDLQKGRSFRIASVSPPPGTMAGRGDTITIHATTVDASEVDSLPAASACSPPMRSRGPLAFRP